MVATLKDNRGIVLTVVIFVVTLLFTLISASLLFSSLDLKTTNSLKTETMSLQAADVGVQHALGVIPAGITFPYTNPPYTSTSPAQIVPTPPATWFPFPTGSGYSYSVTAINTAGDTQAILTSTAQGPNGAQNTILAYVGRGSFGLGATSVPGSTAPNTLTNFSGNSFSINGNDNCTPAAPTVPGIVVTVPALATEITTGSPSGGLASNQTSLVTGAGGTPSVATIPPLSQTVSDIANQYLTAPPPAPPPTTLPGANYSGNGTWGTSTSPQITQITGNTQITGTISGYGVLIVNGSLDIAGNFTFNGLVIATGGNVSVQVTGNAGIYGSLLVSPPTVSGSTVLDVRGNAHIQYSSCALSPANNWVTLPKKAKLVAWQQKF